MRTLFMLALLLLHAADFEGFAQAEGLRLAGNARVEQNLLRLVPARRMQAGAAWLVEPQPVAGGFDTEFVFQMTRPDDNFRGADGLAFVVQNTGPDAVAGVGRSGGFAKSSEVNRAPGISRSLAIFFDTHQNDEEDDPSGNYVSFCVTGDGYWPRRRLHYVRKLKVNMEDEREHRVRITYRPPQLAVYLDNDTKPVLAAALDLREIVETKTGKAWVGFTASTGNGFADHDILRWRFLATDSQSSMLSVESKVSFGAVGDASCLPGHTLCTPARASVEQTGEGRWRIVLPANQEWGASVPAAQVRVRSATGVVCWSPNESGRAVCNGPEGEGRAGRGFVMPKAAPGALVQRERDGRVYFSVNDRTGGFSDNEGFFEIEIEAR